MHRLDSKSYLELMGTASKQLSGPMVGVRGMLLSKCTPSALANIYEDQLRASKSIDVSSTIVQQGNGVTIVFLPGSEGSSVSAIPLLENLHKDVTILVLEHQGKDATSTHFEAYLEAVRPHIGSEHLVVVGMSLGGLSALRLAVLLTEFADVSADSISLIALDSPAISSLSALDQDVVSRLNTVVYISAAGGKSDRNLAAEARWQDMVPATKTHKLDCEHFELWGKSQAVQTAGIINRVIDDILQK